MDKYFSIGEVAKLHNISIQALRHYDKIGLLKPTYINETSGYRYYSAKHFMMLGFIKQCKAMGLTLEEIKGLVDHHTSIEAILESITNQKKWVTQKIEELTQIENNIEILQDKIQKALNEGMNEVFICKCPKRCLIKYRNSKKQREAFEIKLSQVIQEIESRYGTGYKELVFATSYEQFIQQQKIDDDYMMIGCSGMTEGQMEEEVILPEGLYVTLNFDGDFKGTQPYYKKLIEHIEAHKLKVGEYFYETYIMTRVDMNNKETSLGQIQIQLLG